MEALTTISASSSPLQSQETLQAEADLVFAGSALFTDRALDDLQRANEALVAKDQHQANQHKATLIHSGLLALSTALTLGLFYQTRRRFLLFFPTIGAFHLFVSRHNTTALSDNYQQIAAESATHLYDELHAKYTLLGKTLPKRGQTTDGIADRLHQHTAPHLTIDQCRGLATALRGVRLLSREERKIHARSV